MDFKGLRVIDENGEVVGTLDQFKSAYDEFILKGVEEIFDEENKKRYAVAKDQPCPVPFTHVDVSKGCKNCRRNKYCNSFEKK